MAGDERQGHRSKVTLATVAAALGVSATTVSNAFSRPDQLSAGLRDQIFATAAELGYRGPDPVARALTRGRTGLVGLLLTESLSFALRDPAAVLVLQGLGAACDEAGVGLVLLPVVAGERAPVLESRAGVDGYVVYSMPDDDPSVMALVAGERPVVTVDQPQVDGVSFVGVDDREVARLQLSHLLGLGHREVGVLAYRLAPQRSDHALTSEQQATAPYRLTRLRQAGYREALTEAGLPPEALIYEESPTNDAAGGRSAALSLLTRRPTLTALLADGDQIAIGGMQAAADHALHVPDQLSIVSADDTPAAALTSPPLTTASQPFADKGRAAGEELVRLLATTGTTSRTTLLPTQLVARSTTGRPQDGGANWAKSS